MNNKGFAITSILYGILVLFLLVLVSLLGILRSQRLRMEKLSESVNAVMGNVECSTDNLPLLKENASQTARYVLNVNMNDAQATCDVYVAVGQSLQLVSNKIMINDKEAILIGCTNSNITNAIISQICTNNKE